MVGRKKFIFKFIRKSLKNEGAQGVLIRKFKKLISEFTEIESPASIE
mgnify:CR=1 FL=1